MSFAIVGATIAVGAYGAHEQKEASKDAINTQKKAGDASIAESARQFDLTREDTRVSRETGDMAMTALGYLMGIRQPPAAEDIQSMQSELAILQNQLSTVRNAESQSPSFSNRGYLSEAESRRLGTAQNSQNIQQRIDELTKQIDSAQAERNMAMEMGGGMGKVPDLNTLFENVNLPAGANIGSPDDYLPDLDNFLQGLGKDLENSAGYQFELKQGREALKNALSQKGTAYGGNAIKEALQFSQDYASTKYGERFGQALQTYDREYQSGMTRYGMDIDKYNRDRQSAFDQYGLNMDKYRLAKEQGDTEFAHLATLAGYGPAGTQISSNVGQNYAQTVANANQNLATTAGNAAYATAGANTQALSNVLNTGMTMYQYNQMMKRFPQPATS